MHRSIFSFLIAIFFTIGAPLLATEGAQTHIVKMWSDGAIKYYHPDFLRVNVGDTVQFQNLSGHHNTESIKGMIPEGVTPWNSKIDETYDLLITHEGFYGYKCTPHYTKGMVGVIIAGDPTVNFDRARQVKSPKKSQIVFERLFKKTEKLISKP